MNNSSDAITPHDQDNLSLNGTGPDVQPAQVSPMPPEPALSPAPRKRRRAKVNKQVPPSVSAIDPSVAASADASSAA